MSHSFEKISSNKVKISFEIPAEQFDNAVQQAYLKNRNRINVPGFRRGKAPRRVMERMYGDSLFYDDALDLLFPEAYSNAVRELELRPVDRPEMDKLEQIGVGQDLKFDVTVFVYPDVTLGEYKDLEVEIARQEVTDEMIDRRIQQDVDKASRTVDVEDRPVEQGDMVNLDYAGSVDGVAFDGGTAQGQTLTIGSHQFIDGFEDQMVGMNIGEEKDLQVRFPDDYHAENLKGKDAVFHVKVNGIQKVEKPELDDDFAADISDFDTFADYRADIVKQLTEQTNRNNDTMISNAMVEKAAANATVDIPSAMIDDEVENLINNMRYEMAAQGLKLEEYLSYFKMSLDDLKKQRRPEAEQRVKAQLVIEAIRKAEGIEPTEEEVEKAIRDQAEVYGEDVEDFKKNLNESQKEYLKENAQILKVLDFLKEHAKVTDKKPEAQEEKKEDAAEAEETSEETKE